MALLLDTQAFLWWVTNDARLSKRAARAIAASDCLLSVASCWEMALKMSLGKLTLPGPVERFVQASSASGDPYFSQPSHARWYFLRRSRASPG